MRAQEIHELTDRSGRMADGPDCRLPRHGSVWHSEEGIATAGIVRGSIRLQFIGIDFEQPQPAVGDVLGFVEAIAQLHGPYKEIAAGDKGKISPRRRLEYATDDGAIVAAGDRRRDIQLVVGAIKELNGDSGMGSGSGILQYLKQWEIKCDLSISKYPRLSHRCRLIGSGGRRKGCLPQALWCRAFIGP